MQTRDLESYVKGQIEMSPKLSVLSPTDLLCFGVTGMNEESGEVAGLLCREIYKQHPMSREEWMGELGDALWYLVATTLSKGLTLDELFEYNKDKLEERYGHERSKE